MRLIDDESISLNWQEKFCIMVKAYVKSTGQIRCRKQLLPRLHLMSSDLTFITNEQGRSLADRFSVLLGKNTRAFDCLVGYFYLSGFKRLAESLQPTEKIRILIGLNTDQPTFELLSQAKEQMKLDLRSHAEAKERVPGEILSELENVEDSSEVESGVRQFVQWVKNGKLEVRVFPSAQLHAKLYIT